jgi:hypothetical protein
MKKILKLTKPQSATVTKKRSNEQTKTNAKAGTKLNYKNIPFGSNTPVRQQGSLLTTLAVTESSCKSQSLSETP